ALRQPVDQHRPWPHGLDHGVRHRPGARRSGRQAQARTGPHRNGGSCMTLAATTADGLSVNRQNLAFTLDEGIGARARIGLIVLATDHTIEHECRSRLAIAGVAFYESRIMNASAITPETLTLMERDLTRA